MIIILSICMVLSSIHDLIRTKREYISYKPYSIFYITGSLLNLISWTLILYSEYSNKNFIIYFLPLFLIGYTLFYKGLYNLDKFLMDNSQGTKIHKAGYKWFVIIDILSILIGIFLYLIKATVLK